LFCYNIISTDLELADVTYTAWVKVKRWDRSLTVYKTGGKTKFYKVTIAEVMRGKN
jgi:hypothetical protein